MFSSFYLPLQTAKYSGSVCIASEIEKVNQQNLQRKKIYLFLKQICSSMREFKQLMMSILLNIMFLHQWEDFS